MAVSKQTSLGSCLPLCTAPFTGGSFSFNTLGWLSGHVGLVGQLVSLSFGGHSSSQVLAIVSSCLNAAFNGLLHLLTGFREWSCVFTSGTYQAAPLPAPLFGHPPP